MKNKNYWKQYPIVTNPDDIEKVIRKEYFVPEDKNCELLTMKHSQNNSCLLISMGSGGHAYVFAELAYLIYKKGTDVFIMPKHGPHTISELVIRHEDAVKYLQKFYGENIHIYSEGLGGLSVFYLALKGIKIKSFLFENSPAILTESAFHHAMKMDGKAGRRRAFLLPLFKLLVKILPNLLIPIRTYLAWHEVIDKDLKNYEKEEKLVKAYDYDPDFDKSYPLKAVMSLVDTPPPGNLENLNIPTLFIFAKRGLIPVYFKTLFERLTMKEKHLEEVDGGVFWMLSNPEKATEIIIKWINNVKNKNIEAGIKPILNDTSRILNNEI
ncbi:MAG: alpha/beta hydrolase [Bacteroidota bacterium]|nr:alpha/beta hydrolase [Bacteroidota bacterium]MDP3147331.1 alpha/beta hydrolase [Bacteroidota bacterium]